MPKFSLNNRVVVEPYKTDKSLQATVKNGFATVSQKNGVKGLRVLMSTTLANGQHVPAGSTAYIREELLHTQQWAVKSMVSDTFTEPFIIVDAQHIDYIVTPDEAA